MSHRLVLARNTEGRRGSQTRLLDGGRCLDTPRTSPCGGHGDQPELSPFSLSHFGGALHRRIEWERLAEYPKQKTVVVRGPRPPRSRPVTRAAHVCRSWG